MALARNAMLEGQTSVEQAQQFVDQHPAPGYVVVGLSVATGQTRAELTRLTTESLKQRTYLAVEGKWKTSLSREIRESQRSWRQRGLPVFSRDCSMEKTV